MNSPALVSGAPTDIYFFGYAVYMFMFNFCLIYGSAVAFVQAVTAQDWYSDYHLSVAFCEEAVKSWLFV